MITRRTVPNPLAPYADRIAPGEIYTVRSLAALLEMAESGVRTMAQHGWFPGGRMRSHAYGGRMRTWTGRALLAAARRPLRLTFDHETYPPVVLYRVGCRCTECEEDHTARDRERRRARADEAFPAEQRARLLDLVERGTPVADAAGQLGVSPSQVHGRARRDAEFAAALDEAAWALCALGQDSPLCGTAPGYRGNGAQRPPCRGTGCREWRREATRQERAAAT